MNLDNFYISIRLTSSNHLYSNHSSEDEQNSPQIDTPSNHLLPIGWIVSSHYDLTHFSVL